MNFMIEWLEQCVVLAPRTKVRIFELTCNVLLYRHTDDGVFDDFAKMSDHFPKISEDFPKLFRRPDERSLTFSEDYRRLSRKT